PILDEVVGPDMVDPLGPQPHARAVGKPQMAPFWLLAWHFQPLPSPDPPHPFDVDLPAFDSQHPSAPPIAVTAIPAGQPCEGGGQGSIVLANKRTATLRCPRLADDPTGPTFGHRNP